MRDFPPILGIKLDDSLINKIKNHFKWSSFSVGENKVSVTSSGGIHYTGVSTKMKAVTFEITRNNIYIMVSLFEYPRGLIFHAHIYYPQISKIQNETIVKLYEEVKNLLLKEKNLTEKYLEQIQNL